MNVIPPEKNPVSPEPIMPGPVEVPEEFNPKDKVGCSDAITKEMEKRSTAHMLNEHPNDGLKAKCPICGGTNVHYKRGCLDCLKKKAIKKADEEYKEKVEEYDISVEGVYIGSFTINKTELNELYNYLKDTGEFMFVDDSMGLLYLNQPKKLTIILKPKKDPMGYKKRPDKIIPVTKKKRWWKKNEKV